VKKQVPGPQGVRGRNSDNTRVRQVPQWEPEIPLEERLARSMPGLRLKFSRKSLLPLCDLTEARRYD